MRGEQCQTYVKLDESANTKLHLLKTAFKRGRIADLPSDVRLIKKQTKQKNPVTLTVSF